MVPRLSLAILAMFVLIHQGAEAHGSHQHMRNEGHQHYVPKTGQPVKSVLKEDQMIQDREHLREDLKDVYTAEQINRMTPEELDFHYFKLHDYDGNQLLDGLEIMAAIAHILPHDPDLDLGKDGAILTPEEKLSLAEAQYRHDEQMKYYQDMVDSMFKESDVDKNGAIDYKEFVRSRRPNSASH